MSKLIVTKLPNVNTLIFKQIEGNNIFLTSNDTFVISVENFIRILQFLINTGTISYKVFEGLLEEYHTDKGYIDDKS